MPRHRVLFTQMRSGGGSAISLAELVGHLDSDRVEPCVLYYSPNPFSREMEARGVEVRYVSSEDGGASAEPELGPLPGAGVKHVVRRIGGKAVRSAYRELRMTVRDVVRAFSIDRQIGGEIARHIREWRPDLVHHNNSLRGDRAPVLGGTREHARQVCHVRWLHDYRLVDRRVARGIDHFICVSEAVRDTCRALVPDDSRLSVIYNPVDLAAAETASRKPADLRDELGVDADRVLVGMAGRIVPWKGYGVFLDGLGLAARRAPVHGVVVGAPSGEAEEALHRSLEARVREEGLPVSFLGYRDDILEVMAGCDVLVHASTEPEPFGRVVAEAMAVGTPVVATDGGGVPELVEQDVSGLLVPMGDGPGLAEALVRLAGDPSERRRLGCEARRRARVLFSARGHARAVMAVYDRVGS